MSDDIKCSYQEKLGEEFGAVFYRLEVHWISGLVRLKEFQELFGSPDRLDLLNALTGGAFLWDVQQMLWDDLMLRVARLTDSVQSSKSKERLTIRQLPKLLKKPTDAVLRSKLEKDPTLYGETARQVMEACRSAEHARKYRNRRIGHNDLASDLNAQSKPLERTRFCKVQVTLDAIHETLNTVSIRLLGSEIRNEVIVTPRARQFVANASQLAKSVQFVDSLIDPTDSVEFSDLDAAHDFLKKLDQPVDWKRTIQVFDLREVASLFKV